MNRLIIIGNGFDIAHGLKTKYSDFINYYWTKINQSDYKDSFFEFLKFGYDLNDCKSLKSVIEYFASKDISLTKGSTDGNYYHKGILAIRIQNGFFGRLNERYDEVDWVDIEMEYYSSLKRILNREKKEGFNADYFEAESYNKILKLNDEIAQISEEFDKYLESQILPKIDGCYNVRVKELFSNDEQYEHDLKRFYEEFPKNYVDRELKLDYEQKRKEKDTIKKFENTLVLNFNYTDTISHYLRTNMAQIINIHGQVRNTSNPINLGFGDERDKFYTEIEDHNENEFLRFIKSFYYSNNNNYKKLFDFIEESPFQVQIMGHSCGLSDRTLLNAIFENRNCKSIKVYYHSYNQPKLDGQTDNYSEVVRNISRHFNQKTMMRDKIVNKTLCDNLPQLKIH